MGLGLGWRDRCGRRRCQRLLGFHGGCGRRRRRRVSRVGRGRVFGRGGLFRGRLLGRGFLYRRRLFRLDFATQPVGVGAATNPVGLRIFDARGMGLDTNSERESKVECLLVGHTELFGELVHSNFLLGQLVPS
jgi:hypothetical protein